LLERIEPRELDDYAGLDINIDDNCGTYAAVASPRGPVSTTQ